MVVSLFSLWLSVALFCITLRPRARGGCVAGWRPAILHPDSQVNSGRKHLMAAVIFDGGADNMSKIGNFQRKIAHFRINRKLLPLSAPAADFRDVDFYQ
jgi:hypothetical protein